MTKVKIEDLKVFPAVAAVIGEVRAKAELFKLQGVECDFDDWVDLDEAFYWYKTPQGYDFWSDIDDGVNPYAE
jgi:hypothetical protein